MPFTLPPLPYPKDALKPHISAETLEYHYGKHHKAYVDKLNQLVSEDSKHANKSLEELIKTTTGPVFNNAAQVWNHTFYWSCLNPEGGGEPSKKLSAALEQAFGTFDKFKEAFTNAALNTFGSGWAWLVVDTQKALKIVSTSNAENPLKTGQTALLTCDVWEHAYYIDHRNARAEYVKAFWQLVNWGFVEQNKQRA